MKKWFSILMVLMMGVGLVSGCGNSESNSKNKETPPVSSPEKEDSQSNETEEKELSFTFFMNRDVADPPWGEDSTSKWIQENKKVNIDYIPSNGNAKQKLNTLIVGEDLPDVIRMHIKDVDRFIEAGDIIPLDEFITEDTNLYKWVGKELLDMLRAEDGKLYTIPNWFIGGKQGNGNGGWIVNQKIYKELGSPKLETTDDLEAYLRMVKDKYPNVVPLEMNVSQFNSFETLYSAFGEDRTNYYFGNLFYQDGNDLKSIVDDPAFKEMVFYANRLFREKLITQDVFTQKSDQVKEKVEQERVAVFASGNVMSIGGPANAVLKAKDPEGGYDMIWPIHKAGLDKDKIYPNSYNRLGGGAGHAVITKNAKDPQAIFNFLDWALGEEGQRVAFFGPPGLYWDEYDEEGTPIPNEAYLESDFNEQKAHGLRQYVIVGNTTYVDRTKINMEHMLPEEKRDWTAMAQTNVAWKTTYNVTPFANTEPPTNSDEGIIAQGIKDIFDQAFAKMIYAESEEKLLSILDKTKSDMEKAGMDKLLQYKQKVWEQNKKVLKID
ncbi:extracellular solute-binding protein [Paenibacillus sp. J5C_2022]|uniref:extracellular solute-binding protein n=1 Tax=Paenibacillus sp. J5C2022 TaxID=2977129 RepID=UPI0021D3E565|nr:extracellular solute-binding protein [Paenibacillus sp. J5C2022]MCU6710737.1 extracellular solute-binding protein [Paenibacillus sp. J5C2022]